MSTNPWDADFTPAAIDQNLVKDVQAAVTGAEQAVTSATQTVENAVTGAVQTATTPTAVSTTVGGGGGGTTGLTSATVLNDIENVVSAAAKGSAEKALLALVPQLQQELAYEYENALNAALAKVTTAANAAPPITLEDFIHADARSRAVRTLLLGLLTAVLTGVASVAGQMAGVDWFSRDGLLAAGSIALSAVVTSVGAYITRLLKEPEVTKPLTAQLPTKGAAA